MPTSTRNKQDDTRFIEPTENVMFDREGLDRKGIRREFANTMPLALEDLYIEREDIEYVDPRTTNMPYGPTGLGEYGGNGVETVKIDGEEWKTFRYTSGYEWNVEDAANNPDLQQRAILEQFDFLADANFLKGVEDRDGNQVRQGMFDWLDSAIPSARTFDCEEYDGDSGDTADLTGREEDLLAVEAFDNLDFRLVDSTMPSWDLMVGRKEALKQFNHRSKDSDTRREAQSYWEILADDDDSLAQVNGRSFVPNELQLDVLPDGANEDPVTIDLTSEIGSDEVYLLPDMDGVSENYWNVAEMPQPEAFGPYDERGGRKAADWVWRFSQKFDPHTRYGNAPDAIKLENVSALFN